MRWLRELACLLLATSPCFACIGYKAEPENGKQLCASTGNKPCPDNYQCVAGVCCKGGLCPGGAGGSRGGSTGSSGIPTPALQCNPSGVTCAKTGADVPFCCSGMQCKFTVGAKDFWCDGGDCQAAIEGALGECTTSPSITGGAGGLKGGSSGAAGAGGRTTISSTRVGGTSGSAGKIASTPAGGTVVSPTGGTIVTTTASTSPGTVCSEAGIVCTSEAATISACCSVTQCKYVVGSREFPCNGTDCQAATETLASYCTGFAGVGGTSGSAGAGGVPTGGSTTYPTAGSTVRSGGTTTYPTAGAGGAAGSSASPACGATAPCGGDVVGSWTVTSSCLTVSGPIDLSPLGLECLTGEMTGSLKVTGTWSATAYGDYMDQTTTTGDVGINLPRSCLQISGTTVTCASLGSVLQSNGYATMSCSPATNGGCTCAATVNQAGGLGIPAVETWQSGPYVTAGTTLATDVGNYSYCVAGTKLIMTPQSTNPTITGSINLQKSGTGGAGGSAGATSSSNGGASASGGITARSGGASAGATGGTAGATASTDVVTFDNGAATGVMRGYAWIALGALDTVVDPTCGLEEAPITSTQLCETGTNWSTPSQLCVRGTIPALSLTAPDYDQNWGIQIGVDVGPSTAATATLGRSYSDIAVYASNAPAQGFRILVHRYGDDSTRTYCADSVTSGTYVPFTSFRTGCWDPFSGAPLLASDVPNIDRVAVQVSSLSTETSLNMCVNSFEFSY